VLKHQDQVGRVCFVYTSVFSIYFSFSPPTSFPCTTTTTTTTTTTPPPPPQVGVPWSTLVRVSLTVCSSNSHSNSHSNSNSNSNSNNNVRTLSVFERMLTFV